MTKAFSIASWNVEHFGKVSDFETRVNDVGQYLKEQNPDLIAIYEVRSERVFEPLMKQLKGYNFHITEGEQAQEILIAIKSKLTAFVTQKLEFKSGQSTLRPGVLVTIYLDNQFYPVLFLHLKSSNDPKGFGLRNDMLNRAIKFRKRLDQASPNGQANYLFMGDLNTMGLGFPTSKKLVVTAQDEIDYLRKEVEKSKYKMKLLSKSNDYTWFPGLAGRYDYANLDHVIAANHLRFRKYGESEVDVRGWCEKETEILQSDWTDSYSDHCLLFLEVQKV